MWTIRQATQDDIDILVQLRLRFLAEIGYAGDGVVSNIREYFRLSLANGEFEAWLAQADSQVIATSGLVYCQKVPHGRNPSGREGFVLNMYTLREWRNRGIATALMETIVQHVRQQGISCIRLHASEDGLGIYTKVGFRHDNTEMVLNLAK